MSRVKKSLIKVFFLLILQGWICSLISLSEATDFLDREEPQGARGLKDDTKVPLEPIDDTVHYIVSPCPAKLTQVFVNRGQKIEKGELLCIIEMMKMEHSIRSDFSGKINFIFFEADDWVDENSLLISILKGENINQAQASPNEAPPSLNKGKEHKALTISKDGDNQQAQAPQKVSPPSLLWLLRENPIPQLASITLETASPSSFSSSIVPGMTNSVIGPPNNNTPPDNDGKLRKNSTQSIQEEAAGIPRQPSVKSPQTHFVPLDKMESLSLKKRGEEEIKHFPQGKSFFPKSHKFNDASGYSIVTCAKWISGFIVLSQLLFALKTMSHYIFRRPYVRKFYCIISPLPKKMYLCADDFNKQRFMTNRIACNRNCIWLVKRKIA